MRRRELVTALGAALTVAACGQPAATNAPITLSGALNGVYHPGPPASCGQGPTMVMGQFGPDASRDAATLTVSDDGNVTFALAGAVTRPTAAPSAGVFTGKGAGFRAGSGWDLDADLHGRSGEVLTIKGHLPC